MMPRVLVLQMDYHRCLPTPKVSSQDSFYLRKFRTYLFGVYSASEDILNCFFFYNESIGRRGPNEVILLLNYVLETLIERYRTFHNLILWADNSPAQFAFYFFMWTPFSEMEGFFEWVDRKFLLERHSFSICDRRFRCIQQFFNTQEKIESSQRMGNFSTK